MFPVLHRDRDGMRMARECLEDDISFLSTVEQDGNDNGLSRECIGDDGGLHAHPHSPKFKKKTT